MKKIISLMITAIMTINIFANISVFAENINVDLVYPKEGNELGYMFALDMEEELINLDNYEGIRLVSEVAKIYFAQNLKDIKNVANDYDIDFIEENIPIEIEPDPENEVSLFTTGNSILDAEITLSQTNFNYTGNEARPEVIVSYEGDILIKDTDYTLEYKDNIDAGTAKVVITGINNYTDAKDVEFTINSTLPSYFKIIDTEGYADRFVTDRLYTGGPIEPKIAIQKDDEGNLYEEGVDYTLSYTDNTEIGTATIYINWQGNYKGRFPVNFNIVDESNYTPVELTDLTDIADRLKIEWKVSLSKITDDKTRFISKLYYTDDNGEDKIMQLGVDYTIENIEELEDFTRITIKGIEINAHYTGIAAFEVKSITPPYFKIIDMEGYEYNTITNRLYTGGPIEPKIAIQKDDEGNLYEEGVDYTLSYTDNTEIGTATIYINWQGNYKGRFPVNFNIVDESNYTPVELTDLTDIADRLNVEMTSVEYSVNSNKYQNPIKKLSYIDDNGKERVLSEGIDYTASYENIVKGETAKITLKGIEVNAHYTGEIEYEFNVTPAEIQKWISVENITDTYTYTGDYIEPEINIINVDTEYTLEKDIDYTVEYMNNIYPNTKKYTPKVIVTGIGAYQGFISKEFEIINPTPYNGSNDELFSEQWGLIATDVRGFWDNDIRGQGVKLGIVDSYIYTEHPTFQNSNLLPGINTEAYIQGDTENIYNTDLYKHYHGTNVSSVIISGVDDGIGMAGITDKVEARLYQAPTKIYSVVNTLEALNLAYLDGCDIVNLSIGSYSNTPGGTSEARFIDAVADEMIVIVASGNGYKNEYNSLASKDAITVGGVQPVFKDIDTSDMFQRNDNVDKVISVLEPNNYERCDSSTYNDCLTVVAPGYEITYALKAGNGEYSYTKGTGTSVAAPFVTAAAIGVEQMRPGTTTAEFKEILKNTAVDLMDEGYDIYTGWGMINYRNIYEYVSQMPPAEEKEEVELIDISNNDDITYDCIESKAFNFPTYTFISYESFDGPYTSVKVEKSTSNGLGGDLKVYYKGERLTKDVDYTVLYENIDKVGTATAIVKGIERSGFTGSFEIQYDLVNDAKEISSSCLIISDVDTQTYTGEEIKPYISVNRGKKTYKYKADSAISCTTYEYHTIYFLQENEFVEGIDYDITYENNIKPGTATAVIKFKNLLSGEIRKDFEIVDTNNLLQPKTINNENVAIEKTEYTYTGKEIKPNVTVTYDGNTLVEDTDYTVIYENNINIGTAKVIVKGKNNYTGTVAKTFNIIGGTNNNTDIYDENDIYVDIDYWNGTHAFAFNIRNVTDKDINACVMVAVYDENGTLKAIEKANSDIIPANDKLHQETTVTEAKTGYTAKCFVWDSIYTMKPLDKVNNPVYTVE